MEIVQHNIISKYSDSFHDLLKHHFVDRNVQIHIVDNSEMNPSVV